MLVCVLCSRCAAICSSISFVTGGWYSVLAVGVLEYNACSLHRCLRVTSNACALWDAS